MRLPIPSIARSCLLAILFTVSVLLPHNTFAKPVTESVSSRQERLRQLIGAIDPLQPAAPLQVLTNSATRTNLAEAESFTILSVRWPVFPGVTGEGLLLLPRRPPVTRVVAIPDAEQLPEQLAGLVPGLAPERQFARRLAEHGCEVLVPALIDYQDVPAPISSAFCSNSLSRREWLCRLGYPFGRHIIGLEVQKLLAGLNCLEHGASDASSTASASGAPPRVPTGFVGYANGGQLAFFCATLDTRIDAVLLSGCFGSHPRPWEEPVSRQVFGLLPDFADASLATLIAPRALIVEHSPVPNPQRLANTVSSSAKNPSALLTPDFESVETEFNHARQSTVQSGSDRWQLISGTEGMATGPASDRALVAFLQALGVSIDELHPPGKSPADPRPGEALTDRQNRQFNQLSDFLHSLAHHPAAR
jgi:dienelactone hydrolase